MWQAHSLTVPSTLPPRSWRPVCGKQASRHAFSRPITRPRQEWPRPGLLPWLLLSPRFGQLTSLPPQGRQNNMFTHCALRRQTAIVEGGVALEGGVTPGKRLAASSLCSEPCVTRRFKCKRRGWPRCPGRPHPASSTGAGTLGRPLGPRPGPVPCPPILCLRTVCLPPPPPLPAPGRSIISCSERPLLGEGGDGAPGSDLDSCLSMNAPDLDPWEPWVLSGISSKYSDAEKHAASSQSPPEPRRLFPPSLCHYRSSPVPGHLPGAQSWADHLALPPELRASAP